MNPAPADQPRVQFLVLALLALFLFSGLTSAPLIDWDENIYAEAARQMLVRSDFLNPYINDQPFAEKPPFYFWVMATLFKIFGVGEFAARSTSALSHFLFALYLAYRLRSILGPLSFFYAILYAGAFGPLLSARFAVIDNMFNALIGVAAFELLFLMRANQSSTRYKHAMLAALAMGTAVLTKGPLGGVIPLIACSGLILGRALQDSGAASSVFSSVTGLLASSWSHFRKALPLGPLLLTGSLSLAIALSWFVINYLISGPQFLEGFAAFQGMLFSQPLDSHEGPFFYHFIVALVGLFPWTPLLLLYTHQDIRTAVMQKERDLVYFCLGWILFVLILFSFVTTKLPHYSASMYIPQTLLILLALRESIHSSPRWKWVQFLTLGYMMLMGIAFAILPYTFADFREKMGFVMENPPEPHGLAFLPGILLSVLALLTFFFLKKRQWFAYLCSGMFSTALFLSSLWILVLPLYTSHNQGPLRTLMQEAYSKNGDLAMYRFLSFDLFFYGKRTIEVLHSYKFKGNAERLNQHGEKDLYVLCRKDHKLQLTLEHPALEHVRDLGLHSMYVLRGRQ
ncbi:MAG: glycosyltransferase family 39 protein [Spirochaetales bacterium]|nr:glycosyltransferase family 39 protein [Spirochaetales bacterium]